MPSVVKDIDRGWRAIVETVRLVKRNGSYVKVGVLAGSGGDEPADVAKRAQAGRDEKGRYLKRGGGGDGKRGEGSDALTNAELAVVMEYGTDDGRIPARSFVGSTVDKNRERYYKELTLLVRLIYEGKMNLARALDIIGARAANDIKRAVTSGDGIPPPNAEATIKAKGSSRPLIDTGRLIGSVSWLVVLIGGSGGNSESK